MENHNGFLRSRQTRLLEKLASYSVAQSLDKPNPGERFCLGDLEGFMIEY